MAIVSDEHNVLQKKIQDLAIENEHLKKIYEIGNSLRKERNIDKLLPLIMAEISRFLKCDRSTLFLIDYENRYLWTKFAEGMENERIVIGMTMGLIGSSVLTRQVVNVSDAYDTPFFNAEIDKQTGYRTESVLCAPIYDESGDVKGALQLINKRTGVYTNEDETKAVDATSRIAALNLKNESGRNQAKEIVGELKESSSSERSAIFLLDNEKGELRSIMADKIEGWDIQINLNLGIAGLVAVTGKDINIEDVYADTRFDRSVDERTGYRTRCILCVPLVNQSGEILGVVEAINKNDGNFTDYDRMQLKSLVSYLAMFIENALLFDEQSRQFKSLLEVLAASIDAKDTLTAGHSKKVAEYAVDIGRELGFSEEAIDVLSVAALLHDYGKLGIDDHVLKKPGKLTPEEFEHIKLHVVNTRNILSKMVFVRKYRNVPLLASTHHERLDGSGYSEGLSDVQIPFMARILAVADVFEALTAKRHYRDAMTFDEAFGILDREAGTKLDENVISALKRCFRVKSV
jgi:HD-GYP domain-containing protein (c-di-GMP phosphodiesterase class II)